MESIPPDTLPMEFSRQEYQNGSPFPSPENLPDPGIELRSPALQAGSLPSEPSGKKALHIIHFTFIRTLLDWALWFSSYMDELGLSKIQYFT